MAKGKRRAPGRKKRRRPPPVDRPAPPAAEDPEEALQGPPPLEATVLRSDRERREEERVEEHQGTGPRLTGGDVDADWERAATVGDEAVGGTVATPDQDVIDDLGDAWGVPRAPDEEVRTSDEILGRRDRNRWAQDE
jgi:hypothetical protein